MVAATLPRINTLESRLLSIDPRTGLRRSTWMTKFGEFLRPGDLLIVNDAATFPGLLIGETENRERIELRLIEALDNGVWSALALGAGDWRMPTENRGDPALQLSVRVHFGEALEARVVQVLADSRRLVQVRFNLEGPRLMQEIYRLGKPIQYSYLKKELNLWSFQTVFSSRPWAAEMPSAAKPLRWGLLLALMKCGVELAGITHAAGVSSSGDPHVDAMLPLGERYEIPQATVEAVNRARQAGGRVIAVGTSVVRALEGSAFANQGRLVAGLARTELLLHADSELRVVDGILTGMHEMGESHFRLLEAFVKREILDLAIQEAGREGYLNHEFGDSCLILNSA